MFQLMELKNKLIIIIKIIEDKFDQSKETLIF